MQSEKKVYDMGARLFDFSVEVLSFLKNIPDSPENAVIRNQLAKSATSAGANYEESQAGSSKADFVNKIRISLREIRESNYWLRLLDKTVPEIDKSKIDTLLNESVELRNILGTIIQKCRGQETRQKPQGSSK